MTQISDPERHERPTRRRPKVQIAGLVAVVVVLVATVTFATHPWAPGSTTPSPTSVGGASPSGGGSSSPALGGETDWTLIEPVDLPAVATLQPDLGDAAGIQPGSTFSLTSLSGEPAATMAGRMDVSPTAEFAVAPAADGRSATLAPRTPLVAGTVYRFALRAQDGTTSASWAYRVRSPVHVVTTLPGDETTEVPVATGIEVTFDQDGVADMSDHFSIAPAIHGRFDRHGRTQVFVPDGLAASTLYSVTIRSGLTREGTDLTLGSDVVFRFETNGPGSTDVRVRFGREVVESGPGEPPVLGVRIESPDEQVPAAITTADVRVYRLPDVATATRALDGFLVAPRWTARTDPLMAIDGLQIAMQFAAPLERLQDPASAVIRFPAALDVGFYIVEIEGTRKSQAFLQVTPVSAWVSVLSDRTVVWVNDVAKGRPISGASLTVTGGAAIGETDAQGLMVGATPVALIPEAEAGGRALPPGPPIITITAPTGELVLVPFGLGSSGELYRGEWWEKTTSADATYWSLLQSDRSVYRSTDTVDVWGYLRGRDDNAVPPSVRLRIIDSGSSGLAVPPAVTEATVRPRASGAFLASIPLAHAPLGTYLIQAVVDGRVVAASYIDVGIIHKPAYQIALEPDHTAVIAETQVRWTATATFFDDSPVPSLPLSFGDEAVGSDAVTDATGSASITQTASGPDPESGDVNAIDRSLEVRPSGPEGTDIVGQASVLVFPSAVHLAASGVVTDGRLRLTGSLHRVDLGKVEAALADGTWNGDPDGKPVTGAKVRVEATELVPVRAQVGTDYDFIDKIVRPRYEYHTQRRVVRTFTVTTDSAGALKTSIAVPNADHQYEVLLSVADAAGRVERLTIYAGTPVNEMLLDGSVQFQMPAGEAVGETQYGIGDPVIWRMTRAGATLPSGADRYLYIVAQRGLRDVAVTDTATFRHTFKAADAPGIFIIGVRFTGTTYAPKAAAWAGFDTTERAIKVTISADHDRYRPGDDATLTVRTLDAGGHPIAASVVLGGIDQKLYAIGAAAVPMPLDSLYQRVDSGIVRLSATHQVPTNAGSEGEGGDTTGGGGARSDFRDQIAFEALTTGADGRATITVHLSDDLTSWHVTASAVTAGLAAGVGEKIIPVGLPLFVEATVADEYLVSDHPVIRLRAFGEALRAGDTVEFTVSSTSLALAPTRVTGTAFRDVSVALPTLTPGPQKLDISVVAPTRKNANGPLTDRLVRTFSVVGSRLTTARTEYVIAGEPLPVVAGSDAATYTLTDAGRGRFIPVLGDIADGSGARADQALAQAAARDLLIDGFGRDPTSLPPAYFDPSRYEITTTVEEDQTPTGLGIPLLPYGGPDPWLTVRVALIAPDRVDARAVRDALQATRDLQGTSRDLRIASLAGLAALEEPVLADLIEIRALTDLTPTERLYLALGFEAAGDDPSAASIERSILRDSGRQLGPWVRLDIGSTEVERLETTSLFMILAAGLGDPTASNAAEYILGHPSDDATHVLDLVGYVGRALDRTPSVAASFAYTVAGERKLVQLPPGESATIRLIAEQRAGFTIETLTGHVGIAVSWRDPVDVASIHPDADLGLARTPPPDPVRADRLVTVGLSATFAAGAVTSGCYEVVEVVPSGLAPIEGRYGSGDQSTIWPSAIVGQRVTWCIANDPKHPGTTHLRYMARVVNEGSFRWEPAIMQLEGAPEAIALTGSASVRIGAD